MECTIRRNPNWRREGNFVVTFEISKLKPWRRRCPACHHTMEPGKNDLYYCQRTTASGDCRLRPAGAERSRFGNAISGWAGRPYVSMGERPIKFTTSILGKRTLIENTVFSVYPV